ncbi:hypothetical protein [Nostoc sp. NZL]|uniref:hypothetical protein n=1 Tax=Nostoc sp. NZL TaxID=2650612 RepID=UPI0018C668E5|nr:hypothetical protein [Nostoc sp. NZL]
MNSNMQESAVQTSSIIYGVHFAAKKNLSMVSTSVANETAKKNCNPAGKPLHTSEVENIAHTTPEISLISLDIETGKQLSHSPISVNTVENKNIRTPDVHKAFHSNPYERLTSLTHLSNGTFIITCVARTQNGDFNRLIFFNRDKSSRTHKALKVWGFQQDSSTLESLLETQDGKLLGIVSLRGGVPPFELATIDYETGKVTYDPLLPDLQPDRRYSNLAQSPVNRKIYATSMGMGYSLHLVQLDMENNSVMTGKALIIKLSELHFNNKPLESDLLSLAFSSLGKLYAVANLNHEPMNSLFTVDIDTGEMTLVRKLAVIKIAFAY